MATNKSLIFVLLNLILLFSLITAMGCGSDKILMAKEGVEESTGVGETQDVVEAGEPATNPTPNNPEGSAPANSVGEQNKGINLVVSMDFSEGENIVGKNQIYKVDSGAYDTWKNTRFTNDTAKSKYKFKFILTKKGEPPIMTEKVVLYSALISSAYSFENIDFGKYSLKVQALYDSSDTVRYEGSTITDIEITGTNVDVTIKMEEKINFIYVKNEASIKSLLDVKNAPVVEMVDFVYVLSEAVKNTTYLYGVPIVTTNYKTHITIANMLICGLKDVEITISSIKIDNLVVPIDGQNLTMETVASSDTTTDCKKVSRGKYIISSSIVPVVESANTVHKLVISVSSGTVSSEATINFTN